MSRGEVYEETNEPFVRNMVAEVFGRRGALVNDPAHGADSARRNMDSESDVEQWGDEDPDGFARAEETMTQCLQHASRLLQDLQSNALEIDESETETVVKIRRVHDGLAFRLDDLFDIRDWQRNRPSKDILPVKLSKAAKRRRRKWFLKQRWRPVVLSDHQ